MKLVFSSYYAKISAIFLVLLALMAAAHVVVTLRIAERQNVVLDQQVNRDLASDMVREIEPFVQETVDTEQLGSVIHYMMVLNPAVEIYLLDADGRILAFYTAPGADIVREAVSTAPMEAFSAESAELPIYGDDPRHPRQQKHFSAARISLGGE